MVISKNLRISFFLPTFVIPILLLCTTGAYAQAREKLVNGSERESAAIGHFARARALLIEAIAEFELGKSISDPSLIIDTERWRGNIVLRAEELNRVVAPKPKITRQGIEYGENSQLIGFDRPSAQKPLGATENEQKSGAVSKPKTDSKEQDKKPAAPVKETVQKATQTAPIKKIDLTEELIESLEAEANTADSNAQQLADDIANINMEDESDFGAEGTLKQESPIAASPVADKSSRELHEIDIEQELERALSGIE